MSTSLSLTVHTSTSSIIDSIRNYAVLHVPLSECRVFQTKMRAPFMIAVELYRPDELNLQFTKNPSDEIIKINTKTNDEEVNYEDAANDNEAGVMRSKTS